MLILSSSTRAYIAAAYASIFAKTPISELQNQVIGLSEIQVTGEEIRRALEAKHGSPPRIFRQSREELERQTIWRIDEGEPLALAWYCRRLWGIGEFVNAIGSDIWEMEGYQKKTLEDLIVKGEVVRYRDFPLEMLEVLDQMFC